MICERFSRQKTSSLATYHLTYLYIFTAHYMRPHPPVNLEPTLQGSGNGSFHTRRLNNLFRLIHTRLLYSTPYRSGKRRMSRDSNCIRYCGDLGYLFTTTTNTACWKVKYKPFSLGHAYVGYFARYSLLPQVYQTLWICTFIFLSVILWLLD